MRLSTDITYWPGRRLHLYAFGRDDRRTPAEREKIVAKATAKGRKPPRRERLPNRAWWLHASIYRDAARAPAHLTGKELAHWSERDIGTLLKGWFRFGWGRYRHKTVELAFALGGEDSMAQWSFTSPIVSWAFGVKVPRKWLDRWVYQRREWHVHFGYIGSIAHIAFAHDDSMRDMQSYYLGKMDERTEIRGRIWPTDSMIRHNGFAFYLGGAFFVEKQIVSRIFGKKVYAVEKLAPTKVLVVMPNGEGEFEAVVSGYHETWKRPRAWWSRENEGTEIELEHPPRYSGKGENSWDCGDDGTFAMSERRLLSPSEMAEVYREHVLEMRSRYGTPITLAPL